MLEGGRNMQQIGALHPAERQRPRADRVGPGLRGRNGKQQQEDSDDCCHGAGTDLGIMWDNGDSAHRQILMAFGDTNGFCQIPGKQWRYNTLMRSTDGSLANTIAVPEGVVGNKYSGSPVWRPNSTTISSSTWCCTATATTTW
jgi:hypothetical protein